MPNKISWLSVALLVVVCASGLGGCTLENDGQFAVSWGISIDGAAEADLPTACATVQATEVAVAVTRTSDGTVTTFALPCELGSGTTDPLPLGDFSITYTLRDASMATIATVSTRQNGTLVGGDVVTLQRVSFDLVLANVSFTLHMGDPTVVGGNCEPTTAASPGAGVAQQEIDISRHGSATCMAFTVSQLSPASAPTCTPGDCQEDDTTQVINGLPAGTYDLTVYGLETNGSGTGICYVGPNTMAQATFTVGSSDINLGIIDARFDSTLDTTGCATPGCHCQ